MANKRALLVGINAYPTAPLRGCVNDVTEMKKVLQSLYGFQDITLLTDAAATTRAIMDALQKLVAGAAPGDILYFHYSGHGSQYPNNSGTDIEPDGLDEIICPVDLDWRDKMIRDDDLRRIFDKVPAGVNLTVTLDCCNSGSGMDQDNQYQPLGPAAAENTVDPVKGGRYLPPPAEVMYIAESRKLDFTRARALTHRDVNQTGLLLTGCQSHQTSADAYIGGKYMGACTYFLINVLTAHNGKVNYRALVEEVNTKIAKAGFTQRPELNGSRGLFEYNYLVPMGGGDPVANEPQEDDLISLSDESSSVEDVVSPEETAPVLGGGSTDTGNSGDGDGGNSGGKDDKKKKLLIAVGVIAAVAVAIFFSTR